MTVEKPCPYCGEKIKTVAIKCRFCGEWLEMQNENGAKEKRKKPKHRELTNRPKRVGVAVGLLYLRLGSGIALFPFSFVDFLIFIFFSILIFLIAKGRNWARISYLLILVCSIPIYFLALPKTIGEYHRMFFILEGGMFLLLIIAMFLLFQKKSSNWFKGKTTKKESEIDTQEKQDKGFRTEKQIKTDDLSLLISLIIFGIFSLFAFSVEKAEYVFHPVFIIVIAGVSLVVFLILLLLVHTAVKFLNETKGRRKKIGVISLVISLVVFGILSAIGITGLSERIVLHPTDIIGVAGRTLLEFGIILIVVHKIIKYVMEAPPPSPPSLPPSGP